jgi:hypothetical protein
VRFRVPDADWLGEQLKERFMLVHATKLNKVKA